MGVKSLIKIKPEILEEKVTLKEVIETIKSKEKITKKEKNILEGNTQKDTKIPNKKNILEINYNIIGDGRAIFN